MPVEYGLTTAGFLPFTGVVAFDALLGVVAGLALFDDELDAADAAVALVEHVEIVRHAVGDRNARSGEGAGPIGEERNIDALFCMSRDRRDRQGGGDRQAERRDSFTHAVFLPLFARACAGALLTALDRGTRGPGLPPARDLGRVCTISTERATPSISACQFATAGRARSARHQKDDDQAPTITKVNCSAAAGWIGRPKAAGTARSTIGKM